MGNDCALQKLSSFPEPPKVMERAAGDSGRKSRKQWVTRALLQDAASKLAAVVKASEARALQAATEARTAKRVSSHA